MKLKLEERTNDFLRKGSKMTELKESKNEITCEVCGKILLNPDNICSIGFAVKNNWYRCVSCGKLCCPNCSVRFLLYHSLSLLGICCLDSPDQYSNNINLV